MKTYSRQLLIAITLLFAGTGFAKDPDFEGLILKFKHAVIPMELQEEMWLRQEIISIDLGDEDSVALKIKKYVEELLSPDEDDIDQVDDIQIKRFTAHTRGLLKKITDLIFAQTGYPHYCMNFKNLDPDDFGEAGFFDDCEKETRALLGKLGSDRLSKRKYKSLYFVTVEGLHDYGDYQRAFLFVQSPSDRGEFLMYDFDLVHEI